MRIDKIGSTNSPWEYRSTGKSGQEGAQIDMLIDRQDMVINSAYAKELRRQIEVFRNQTQTKKSVFLTLVIPFGLKENLHSISLNAVGVNMESLFEEINLLN